MESNKKINTRKELFESIWKIANNLRGKVEHNDFKNYILGFLFYRFISENISNYIDENYGNELNKKYELLTDNESKNICDDFKNEIINKKGIFIYPHQLFVNVYKKHKNGNYINNLNEDLFNTFKNIQSYSQIEETANNSIKGLFNIIDLNSINIAGSDDVLTINKHLLKIMSHILDFKLNNFQNNSYDIFGDAYEYLIRMYASNAGKSGGEFFTPQTVSKLLALICIKEKNDENILDIYDPACGSGSLLLQISKCINKNVDIKYYGQESNPQTYNLCRMNMFLHNISFNKFDIKHGDTLLNPLHKNKEFDIILSNPPYSIEWEGNNNQTLIEDKRFMDAGALAPKNRGDFAFIQHIIYFLKKNGIAAVVCFPGILFRKGTEYTIRKWMVDKGYIKAIIQLPKDLFYGTSIDTNILVITKQTNQFIRFIDASELFQRIEAKNILNDENIEKILSAFSCKIDIDNFLHIAKMDEIIVNNYDLSVNKYIKTKINDEIIDINTLNKKIKEISNHNINLRLEIDKIIEEIENEWN